MKHLWTPLVRIILLLCAYAELGRAEGRYYPPPIF